MNIDTFPQKLWDTHERERSAIRIRDVAIRVLPSIVQAQEQASRSVLVRQAFSIGEEFEKQWCEYCAKNLKSE